MKKDKKKPHKRTLILIIFLITLFIFSPRGLKKGETKIIDLKEKSLMEIKEYAKQLDLKLKIKEEYSKQLKRGKIISQNPKKGTKIEKGVLLIITLSLGQKDQKYYQKYKVDELGKIPIIMYHGIQNLKNEETVYIGGNIDKDGYQRTAEAFCQDLEFYYENGYRMIRLNDYIDGIIDVEVGYSPLILTFDDGLKNNIRVTGIDKKGNLIIDPHCAVGILERFKEKYPDFKVTATFFPNAGLFGQPEYNKQILKWLISNGYDIGNHSYGHDYLNKITPKAASQEIGRMYHLLEEVIEDKYVKIVALPFGLPASSNHQNFPFLIESTYKGKTYKTKGILKEAWESELSPFHDKFNPLFLKRIRAYDNNGSDYDITHNFKLLEKTRYISDGDKKTIVIPKEKKEKLKKGITLEVIEY